MDNPEILFYIIIAVIALLSRAFKKKEVPPPRKQPGAGQSKPKQQPLSFEELLKEFTGEETRKPEETMSYDDPVEEEVIEFKGDYPTDDEIQEVYEKSIQEASEFKTLDEQVDPEDDRHTGSFQHFRGYSEEDTADQGASEYIESLKDVEEAKRAIILSEIINKKY